MSKKKKKKDETTEIVDETETAEVLIDLAHDPFLRHITLSVHFSHTSRPEDYLEELRRIVDEYLEKPNELFQEARDIGEFH